jgi:hypothetical protein
MGCPEFPRNKGYYVFAPVNIDKASRLKSSLINRKLRDINRKAYCVDIHLGNEPHSAAASCRCGRMTFNRRTLSASANFDAALSAHVRGRRQARFPPGEPRHKGRSSGAAGPPRDDQDEKSLIRGSSAMSGRGGFQRHGGREAPPPRRRSC